MLVQMTRRLSSQLTFHCINIQGIFFTRLSVGGHFGWFHILAIVNNASVNMEVHVSFQMRVFAFFRKTPGSGTAGLHGGRGPDPEARTAAAV